VVHRVLSTKEVAPETAGIARRAPVGQLWKAEHQMTSVSPLASRRDLLAGLAGLSVTALGGLGAPPAHAAAAFGPGLKSRKAWHSGSSISDYGAFESFRGRRLDTITCWCQHENWSEVVALKGGFTTASGSGARISCGIAPLPRSHPG
jgi:hypothetical protein